MKSMKMAVAAALAGGSVLVGGFLIGGSLVSAEEPAPGAGQEAASGGSGSGATGGVREGECDQDDGAGSSGIGFRGPRGLSRQ